MCAAVTNTHRSGRVQQQDNKRKNESALRIHNSFFALQEQVHPSTKTYYLLHTITMSLVVSSWDKIKAIDSYDEVAGEMLFKR